MREGMRGRIFKTGLGLGGGGGRHANVTTAVRYVDQPRLLCFYTVVCGPEILLKRRVKNGLPPLDATRRYHRTKVWGSGIEIGPWSLGKDATAL